MPNKCFDYNEETIKFKLKKGDFNKKKTRFGSFTRKVQMERLRKKSGQNQVPQFIIGMGLSVVIRMILKIFQKIVPVSRKASLNFELVKRSSNVGHKN